MSRPPADWNAPVQDFDIWWTTSYVLPNFRNLISSPFFSLWYACKRAEWKAENDKRQKSGEWRNAETEKEREREKHAAKIFTEVETKRDR